DAGADDALDRLVRVGDGRAVGLGRHHEVQGAEPVDRDEVRLGGEREGEREVVGDGEFGHGTTLAPRGTPLLADGCRGGGPGYGPGLSASSSRCRESTRAALSVPASTASLSA